MGLTIHYHGLPISPDTMLLTLGGRHVCISYATKRDSQVEICLRLMQSILFDCGEYTLYRQGGELDRDAYYTWLRLMLRPPHWAIIPDKIDGSVDQQRELVRTWPFHKSLGAPVWHLGLPLQYLAELVAEWPRVCLGSSGAFWNVGSPDWRARMSEVARIVDGSACHIHGLRMMDEAGNWHFLASVDSVNIARNYKDREVMPDRMADRLDSVNAPPYSPPVEQEMDLLG